MVGVSAVVWTQRLREQHHMEEFQARWGVTNQTDTSVERGIGLDTLVARLPPATRDSARLAMDSLFSHIAIGPERAQFELPWYTWAAVILMYSLPLALLALTFAWWIGRRR
ncbi:MAG: hypothetical protein ABI765_07930 [Gemmatimonadota bacterium]